MNIVKTETYEIPRMKAPPDEHERDNIVSRFLHLTRCKGCQRDAFESGGLRAAALMVTIGFVLRAIMYQTSAMTWHEFVFHDSMLRITILFAFSIADSLRAQRNIWRKRAFEASEGQVRKIVDELAETIGAVRIGKSGIAVKMGSPFDAPSSSKSKAPVS